MSQILHRFQSFHGQNTRQIGRYFCIPASISNALRILGFDTFTQERIRDLWYVDQGRQVEANLDDQMTGDSFDSVIRALSSDPGFVDVAHRSFSKPGDDNPLDLTKSREALTFIVDQITNEHPVIVSTWNLAINTSGDFSMNGYHMWLILSVSLQSNSFVYHDPENDQVYTGPICETQEIQTNKGIIQLPAGLLGKITHSDYNCLALWRNQL